MHLVGEGAQATLDFSETFNEPLMETVCREIKDELVFIMRGRCPVLTGRLLWSEGGFIGGSVIGNVVTVGAGQLSGPEIAGTGDSSYAYYLQTGTKYMAPRPLLPTETEVVQVLQEVFSGHSSKG
jgi:hypothetical protein